MSEEKTYQPKWEERKSGKRRHHHHSDKPWRSSTHTNTWGGWMKLKDKQAYYGLMFIVIVGLAFGAYKLVMLFVDEFRAMPMDDPKTEMRVDELDIHHVDKQEALLLGDSLAQTYQLDSIKRVHTTWHHVYRPPRREKQWYITKREWKDIWRNMKRWKQARKNDEKMNRQTKEQDNRSEE
jgi:hypothetical protein